MRTSQTWKTLRREDRSELSPLTYAERLNAHDVRRILGPVRGNAF